MSRDFRYVVTVDTGVSIGIRRYIETVALSGPRPMEAVANAFRKIVRRDPENQLWQSDKVTISVERER